MKKIILVALTLAAVSVKADVFAEYETVGHQALVMSKNTETKTEDFVTKIKELTTLGYQIMDLYQVKYTECVEQFAQLKSMDADILKMSYDEMDVQLHDGKGLIVAPKVCYKGRSMVVHPYQVAALSIEKNLFTSEGQEIADHELNEVIERAGKIKKDLGL
jgi:cellobiose-specific phosphotransferase system component IIB